MRQGRREAELRGRLLARTLHRAWRAAPPPPEVGADELQEASPLLLRTGSAALAWWRIRDSPLALGPAATVLRDAYRFQALQGAVLEERLPRAISLLRAAGAEPLVAKGWAVARLYPEPGLRPYGDIDLYVRPSQYRVAREALEATRGLAVDLHRGLLDLDDRDQEGVFTRARTIAFGGVDVPMLSAEDHLRLLCRHLLRHGAARPVWLCDVGLSVESRPPEFDWDRLLAGSPRRRQAVRAVLALAGILLGADLSGTPVTVAEPLAPWLVPAVLRQWGEGVVCHEPLATYLGRPAALAEELRRHWPNPIEASSVLDAPFNALPRFPYQAVHVLVRSVRFVLARSRGAAAPLPVATR